jgi:hypothetical protein
MAKFSHSPYCTYISKCPFLSSTILDPHCFPILYSSTKSFMAIFFSPLIFLLIFIQFSPTFCCTPIGQWPINFGQFPPAAPFIPQPAIFAPGKIQNNWNLNVSFAKDLTTLRPQKQLMIVRTNRRRRKRWNWN